MALRPMANPTSHRPAIRKIRPAMIRAPGMCRAPMALAVSPVRASPHRPPNPAAKGQAAGAASAARAADRARVPPVAARAFNGVGFSRCWIASPTARARPKATSSSAAGQAASPSDCMNRSANRAPLAPSQLVVGRVEAAFRLASAGFQDSRAISSRAANKACSTPRNRTTKGASHRMRALIQA